MRKAVIYIHGQGGNADEADFYRHIFPGYDVIGFDYSSEFPWEAEHEFPVLFDNIAKHYDSIIIIANSIGAYFTMVSLYSKNIKRAYFISPVVDMQELIERMMSWANVDETELREKGTIETSFGQTLSWDYLTYARNNYVKWEVPTCILYGSNDNLTPLSSVSAFAEQNGYSLTVMEGGEHWFHTEEQLAFLKKWLESI